MKKRKLTKAQQERQRRYAAMRVRVVKTRKEKVKIVERYGEFTLIRGDDIIATNSAGRYCLIPISMVEDQTFVSFKVWRGSKEEATRIRRLKACQLMGPRLKVTQIRPCKRIKIVNNNPQP